MIGMSTPHPVAPRMGLFVTAGRVARQARARFYPATGVALPLCGAALRGRRAGMAQASKIPDPLFTSPMPRSPAAAPETASYEQALAELERLLQAMEGGQMPLDQLLASYRRGAELLQLCRAKLQVVEDQVKLLEDGQLKPWAVT